MRSPVKIAGRHHAWRVARPAGATRPAAGTHPMLRAAGPALLLIAVLAGGAAPSLHAAEHITLRNGFELNCDHRSLTPADGNVRLFLDAAEANYVDVPLNDILSADAFVPAAPAAPGAAAAAATAPRPIVAPHSAPRPDLTPAELHELLAGAGTAHDLDVDLLASLVHAESGSHVRAVSRTGAQGLMQLMPGTAAQLGVTDAFAPEANVHGGTAYLDSLLKRYHDNLALALAAYNAGPGAVDRYHGVPPYRETRAYVARIIQEFNRRYAARQAAASYSGSSQTAQVVAAR